MSEIRQVGEGEVVFQEGSTGEEMYVVRSGRVVVSTGPHVLAELGPGAMFGEHGLLRSLPRTATVTALDETELEVLDRDSFAEKAKTDPMFALRVLEHIADMTHKLADEFMRLAEEEEYARQRLAEIEFEGHVRPDGG